VFLTSLGNTKLQPETSREVEGGADVALWGNRVELTYSLYNKTRYNAIVSIPVAASVYGGGSINYNIGTVRNTGTELTLNTQLVQSRAANWTVGINYTENANVLVSLTSSAQSLVGAATVAADGGAVERNVPGYPLFGLWTSPVASYADANHDGVIEGNEIRYGDSLVYVGQSDPKHQMNVFTDLSLFSNRLSVHATVAYQQGMTQFNRAAISSGALEMLGNAPGVSLGTEAAIQAADPLNFHSGIGAVQVVNLLRFQDLSISYVAPTSWASWFHVSRLQVTLTGSNLGLHTNYRGLDPNVNAISTGNGTEDLGQLPLPRQWQLGISLGN
jgi:hypothetical protein